MKIALTFSGGGYRAASYSLGVLSYLESLKTKDGSLLDQVVALSTVSGGTITGLRYALGMSEGESFQTIYKHIYTFMLNTDLLGESLDILVNDKAFASGRTRSLICAFAELYDKRLFNHATFSKLMKDRPYPHLRHLSFNSTEFDNALQFRFQWTEKILDPEPDEPERGIMGNYYFKVPEAAGREIRLGDILAASSCFPGGFEPINFPGDFIMADTPDVKQFKADFGRNIGLMDGGIVDNQGIEPVLLAENRMKRNSRINAGAELNLRELDLIMIVDVASPFMEGYVASEQKPGKWWSKLTLNSIVLINAVFLVMGFGGIYLGVKKMLVLLIIFSTALVTLTGFCFLLLRWMKNIPVTFQVPKLFLKPLGKLLKLKLYVYEGLIYNRSNSLLKMAMSVFLKHVRRLNYKKIYEDGSWRNRRIMNAIYELKAEPRTFEEAEVRAKKKDVNYPPSAEIQEVTSFASGMGTTLWFSGNEQERLLMLNSIIACGQFTTCWNLLEYIAGIKKNPINTNASHQWLLQLEPQLLKDWEIFKAKPKCKVTTTFLINNSSLQHG